MDPNKYKLIAFDLDGTLLNTDEQISPYTKEILKRLRTKGMHLTLATGRFLPAVKEYADALNIECPLIMSNGSILQTRQGIMISQFYLLPETVEIIIDSCRNEKVEMLALIDNIFYYKNQTGRKEMAYKGEPYEKQEAEDWYDLGDKLSRINKFSIINPYSKTEIDRLNEVLKPRLVGLTQMVQTGPNIIEMQPHGITKAAGLRKVAAQIGIDMQQIIAFGDHNNDVEMLAEAGLGIAVGNASPACIEHADLQIASSDQDGPAHFLEEIFFEK